VKFLRAGEPEKAVLFIGVHIDFDIGKQTRSVLYLINDKRGFVFPEE
jgi:hypothetical protein